MKKVNSDDILEIEDYLTQQLDGWGTSCAAGSQKTFSDLFKAASAEIKRLRKLLRENILNGF